jgi:FAD/FMN-containing dehydrogenase
MKANQEILPPTLRLGDAQRRARNWIREEHYMPWMFTGVDLEAQRRLKDAFDPEGLMNPFTLFPTPVWCGELMTHRSARLAGSGLGI